MQNFKLRTLALLEAYSQAAPGSGLIAGILPDLVRAADASGKPGAAKAVAERLKSVVNKICRSVNCSWAACGGGPRPGRPRGGGHCTIAALVIAVLARRLCR